MKSKDTNGSTGTKNYSQLELNQAITAITSLLHKCEKSLVKIKPGTSQHTLLSNRIKALSISQDLIHQSISNDDHSQSVS